VSALVPAEPFAEWLAAMSRRHGRQTVREKLAIGGEAFLALEALVPGDELPLELVDRYLTRADGPDTLATLYPAVDQAAGRRKDFGRSYVCDEQTLIAAHSMHMDGMSARQVAREVFDDCYSATPKALANALLNAWRRRGWEIRTQSEATALANSARTFRPQCSHIFGRKAWRGAPGSRCERRCVGNDETCWHHDPARIAANVERLRDAA
jgi:hypothetical protein